MMKKANIGLLLTLMLIMVGFSSCREQSKSAKIVFNEIQTLNEGGIQDEYGQSVGWIELFNKSYGIVNIQGYTIKVTQGGNEYSYSIPKGDVNTIMQPRQFVVFFADGKTDRGTFHTSFTLDPTKEITFELYDNAQKFVDKAVLPAGKLGVGQSWGLEKDEYGYYESWEVKGGSKAKPVTPNANNHENTSSSKSEKFATQDSIGIGMAISAMTVVFSCLLLLWIAFKLTGIASMKLDERNKKKAEKPAAAQAAKPAEKKADDKQEEVYAAIFMALHEMQSDVHDVEDMVLTINQDESPWRSKALTLRKSPSRK